VGRRKRRGRGGGRGAQLDSLTVREWMGIRWHLKRQDGAQHEVEDYSSAPDVIAAP